MINALRDDEIIRLVGGRFKLTALMQKRWIELMQGSRPMVDDTEKTVLDVITEEILQGKISAEFEDASRPQPATTNA